MSHDNGGSARACPLSAPGALEAPVEWAELRAACPVAPVALPSGDRAALLTRYADVKQVLSDPRCTRRLDAEGAARIPADGSGGVFSSSMAESLNGAGRQRWRRMVVLDVLLRRLPGLELAVAPGALRRVEGLVAGGLCEVPVRW
ncbi:hypothetical protein [Streptomyces noursei]|uniref:hypothetical protein n=1 Tax=Streptomyces noursei TaxID=1971 RepID=UPI001677F1A1|nr:hypothetical protein [Streptomyces noursei]GGX37857.1 hypothetical protein GCM10010341_69800 [Streptomyces noursei]